MSVCGSEQFWPIARFILLTMALLTACSLEDARDTLGIGKQSPDEYLVVERAPLSLPPNFDLRPPTPGETRTQYEDLRRQAERILLGETENVDGARSEGEVALLKGAGGLDVDPRIRQKIDGDSGSLLVENRGLIEEIMFWKVGNGTELIIDPIAEAERLRKNASAGLPVTYGASPTIRRKK